MKQRFRIVFMGTPDFAVPSLMRLVNSEIEVAAVVTAADKPAGRGQKIHASAVKRFAISHGLTVLQPLKLRDPDFIDTLRSLKADLFVVVAFRMLPEVVWSMPQKGTINLHGSLLPDYRGAAPIHHAVMNGEKITGCTTFFISHAIDTGDIIDQCTIPIGDNDTTGDIHDLMMHKGAELLLSTVRSIAAGKAIVRKQTSDDAGKLKEAPKLVKEMGHIDWHAPVAQIHNKVRGLSPFPAAYAMLKDQAVRIFYGAPSEALAGMPNAEPGYIYHQNNLLAVRCSDGWFTIESLQMPGKRRVDVKAFSAGNSLDALTFS